jgi:metal-responsive CopG/Arc/MetJ family transcriptional regulator
MPSRYGSMAISMAVKMTFSLDETTVEALNRTAGRLAKPKSEVVREAIREYDAKSDRLSETEKRRMLKLLQEYSKQPAEKTRAEVDRELRAIRESRRRGWSRPSDLR